MGAKDRTDGGTAVTGITFGLDNRGGFGEGPVIVIVVGRSFDKARGGPEMHPPPGSYIASMSIGPNRGRSAHLDLLVHLPLGATYGV